MHSLTIAPLVFAFLKRNFFSLANTASSIEHTFRFWACNDNVICYCVSEVIYWRVKCYLYTLVEDYIMPNKVNNASIRVINSPLD